MPATLAMRMEYVYVQTERSENRTMDGTALKIILFLVGSVGLLGVSRRSLRVARSQGFYRIFAWEAMLALALVNIQEWFTEPFSLLHIASWIFLAAALVVLLPGAHLLLTEGKPTSARKDDTLFSFEKTTVLVTDGIYSYIRHPLYGSLLYLAWGIFLKEVTWASVGLIAVASFFLTATAKADETECIKYFGPSYKEYMLRSKMFVPFIW
jgi:protein-S-isoprenylcysteine O-methyltransferase Ste14